MLLPADSCIYMHQPTRKHQLCQAAYRPSVCCRAPHLTGSHTCFVSFYIFVWGGVIEHEFFLMTFPQGQSFWSFQTALATVPQAGRTLSSCWWDGLSRTMHFFGSTRSGWFFPVNLIKYFVNTAAYYRSDSIGHPSSGAWIGHPGR